jgi:hypothetical protein
MAMAQYRRRLPARVHHRHDAARTTLAQIHGRMPAILEGDALSLWLNRKSEPNELLSLLEPARDDLLKARPVSPAVNDVKNDRPELLDEWLDMPRATILLTDEIVPRRADPRRPGRAFSGACFTCMEFWAPPALPTGASPLIVAR